MKQICCYILEVLSHIFIAKSSIYFIITLSILFPLPQLRNWTSPLILPLKIDFRCLLSRGHAMFNGTDLCLDHPVLIQLIYTLFVLLFCLLCSIIFQCTFFLFLFSGAMRTVVLSMFNKTCNL